MKSACWIVTENRPETSQSALVYVMYPWEHKWRYVQMQQSAKPDLGAAFLSVGLDAAGAQAAVASDLSWRNALVLEINVKQGSYKYSKNVTYLNALAEACHSRPISTRI